MIHPIFKQILGFSILCVQGCSGFSDPDPIPPTPTKPGMVGSGGMMGAGGIAPHTCIQDPDMYPAIQLDIPLILQQTPVWCWVATSEMAIRYYRPDFGMTQCEMLETGYGLLPGTCCTGGGVNCERPVQTFTEIKALIETTARVPTFQSGSMDWFTLYGRLKECRPVLAGIRNHNAGHVVVITGVSIPDRCTPWVSINDPLSFFEDQRVPFSRLSPIWSDALTVGEVGMATCLPGGFEF